VGVTGIGISRDSPWSHRAWREALDIDVPLLSDWNGEAVAAFDNAFDHHGLHGVARRSAFLVDGEGTVRGAWSYETGEVPDFDELIAAARALSSA
jgi:glutaredoxin-dependent peroxiredoxin